MRLYRHVEAGQTPIIFHLGDHDPSGKDMTRDIIDRIELFTTRSIEVKRIALNMNQIEEFNPPPNPAKITDSRATAYIAEFGYNSWELDALEPSVMVDLIEESLSSVRDDDQWEKDVERQEEQRELLTAASERWEEVTAFLNNGDH